MTFIYKLDSYRWRYPRRTNMNYVETFETVRITDRQTDRQTDGTENMPLRGW